MHCADLEASFVSTAALSGKQYGQMARRMNWLHPVESALRKPYNSISTIPDLWREWTVGLGGQLSVEALDERWGSRWGRGAEF
jgi:hypothetical protein